MKFLAMGHFLKPFRIGVQVVHHHHLPDVGQPVDGADDEIDAEQEQQADKPPGVVHVGHIEHLEELCGALAKVFNVKLGRVFLGNQGADDGGCGQDQQGKKGKPDGCKKAPHHVFCFFHMRLVTRILGEEGLGKEGQPCILIGV